MQEKHHQDKVNSNLKMSPFLPPPPFCCNFNLRTFKDLSSFHVKKGFKTTQLHIAAFENDYNKSNFKWLLPIVRSQKGHNFGRHFAAKRRTIV